MLQAMTTSLSLACVAATLVVCCGVAGWRLFGWWRMRRLRQDLAAPQSLEETRAYVEWVRHMPPPPERPRVPVAVVPVPVKPPGRGKWRPFPGRNVAGG